MGVGGGGRGRGWVLRVPGQGGYHVMKTDHLLLPSDCPQVQCVHPYVAQQPDELTLELADILNILDKTEDGEARGWCLCPRGFLRPPMGLCWGEGVPLPVWLPTPTPCPAVPFPSSGPGISLPITVGGGMKTRNTPTHTCICSKLPDELVNTRLVAPMGHEATPWGSCPLLLLIPAPEVGSPLLENGSLISTSVVPNLNPQSAQSVSPHPSSSPFLRSWLQGLRLVTSGEDHVHHRKS